MANAEKRSIPIKRAKNKPTNKNPQPDAWWIRSTAETCEFFDISDEALRKWAMKGAPKVARGKWDVKALIAWKYDSETSANQRKLNAEAKLKEAKASIEQIRLEVTKKKYVEAAQVTRDLNRLFASLKKSFTALGHRITTELNAMDPDMAITAGKVVGDTVREALEKLAAGKEIGKK